MGKIELKRHEVSKWMHQNWYMYASQTLNGKRLIMYLNHVSFIKVVYDDTVMYLGNNLDKALEVWNSAS
jgi:hypothetical protein